MSLFPAAARAASARSLYSARPLSFPRARLFSQSPSFLRSESTANSPLWSGARPNNGTTTTTTTAASPASSMKGMVADVPLTASSRLATQGPGGIYTSGSSGDDIGALFAPPGPGAPGLRRPTSTLPPPPSSSSSPSSLSTPPSPPLDSDPSLSTTTTTPPSSHPSMPPPSPSTTTTTAGMTDHQSFRLDDMSIFSSSSLTKLRTTTSLGRSIVVQRQNNSLSTIAAVTGAITTMNRICSANAVAVTQRMQRFHERPGLKRKRLKMQRWKKNFKTRFSATVERIKYLKTKGW